ncbi:ester hydrolase C11orf54 homolog [Mizuhopecten yessoensis]|uniref:Ester hydrolase C11orf54-like n=1 Tax=Mizuhopecten yessoensis TaxID=6573 RepID=A0A210QIS0_MIZYE|nr:ester hydrolase C11orf54 homolog [Mizuhopecten yessoensis]OWF48632.1 Ester hydrolase C11orf54-like [Mizuhopecten yessoensis]
MAASPPVQKASTHVPSLDEVAKALSGGLSQNFANVSTSVVDCPDLTKKPFMLVSEGLGGNPRLADVGGPGFLTPTPQTDKKFTFAQIAKLAELPGAFMIGAGAGPCQHVGCNSELMNNILLDSNGGVVRNNAHIAKVNPENNACVLEKLSCPEFNLMGNFLISEGKSGKVLEVKAGKRTGEENFVSCMRKTLKSYYGDKIVALGGVFLIEKGKANLHIMPDFAKEPLHTNEEVKNWLKFYDMSAPLVCVGELVSHDPGMDLRVEHFHCFSEHGEGGHYHWDTTPEDVQYRGYFVLADYIYRVDQPPNITDLAR